MSDANKDTVNVVPSSPRTADDHEELVQQMTATADDQDYSPFFSQLPTEIRRLIYTEIWRTWGLSIHIAYTFGFLGGSGRPTGGPIHVPCVIDQEDPDLRFESYQKASSEDEKHVWARRVKSDWTVHWRCQEQMASGKQAPSPFLPVLLTCKRFYVEGIESILESITFCHTETMTATKFLSCFPGSHIRSLDIALQLSASLTDFYLAQPGNDDTAIIVGSGSVNKRNNFWENLCLRLTELPNLRHLRFWISSRDLRAWHRSVAETRLFARLYNVRQTERFVLCLPDIPKDPEARGMRGCYLEDRQAEEEEATALSNAKRKTAAPFTLKRGKRPNNWEFHLSTRAAGHPRLYNEVPVLRRTPLHWMA